MKDYIVQVRIKNARMRRAMRAAGFQSMVEVARHAGVRADSVREYMALKRAPFDRQGNLREDIVRIAHSLGVHPEDLFPPQHLRKALRSSTAEREVNLDELEVLAAGPETPEAAFQLGEQRALIHEALKRIDPKDAHAIREYYGVDGGSGGVRLADVARDLGVTTERARQRMLRGVKRVGRAMAYVVDDVGHGESLDPSEETLRRVRGVI